MALILNVTRNGKTTSERITTGLGDVQGIKKILNFMYPDISTEQDPEAKRRRDEQAKNDYLKSIK